MKKKRKKENVTHHKIKFLNEDTQLRNINEVRIRRAVPAGKALIKY